MRIDFHVHLFPDKIAAKALPKLAAICKSPYYTAGTHKDTKEKMQDWKVDAAVAMNIATTPHQQKSVNDWAASIQNTTLYAFGSVHPDAPDALEELQRIKSLGLRGVKLHPDYQGFQIDEKRLYPLYEEICALGLPVLFHTGWDPLSPDLVHAPPRAVAKIVREFPKMKMIAAHLGGMALYDEVEQELCGLPVFFDTAMSARLCPPEQFERIVRRHGAEQILFGSDCPWSRSCDEWAYIEHTGLSDADKEKILSQNAQMLLGL